VGEARAADPVRALASPVVVTPYQPEHAADWDRFVDRSPNGLLLFRRGYMDYHADRFADASVWLSEGGRPVAVLPASRDGDTVVSHGGLTFGGLVLAPETRLATVVEAVAALCDHARATGVRSLRYKQTPAFLSDPLASPDDYALHRAGAALVRVEPNLVVDLLSRPPLQERRARSARRAQRLGVEVRTSDDLAAFWQILEPVLARHGVQPVHSVAEIELLRSRFPADITLRAAYLHGTMVAGSVLYRYGHVLHSQYSAAADAGRDAGALDLVFASLLDELQPPLRWLSFGISSEQGGAVLNEGLTAWKEGFGARCLPHLVYELLA
jgi:hypothetical protein